jgi:AAA family ATP:ADP antiporter
MSAPSQSDDARDAGLASLCAAALIAWQVAGKATRDALFLSSFAVEKLPVMIAAAAVFSLMVVVLASRLIRRIGPEKLVPRAFLASAVVLVAVGLIAGRAPRMAAVAVFFHVAGFGAILVSGFWSALNERFDPRAARQRFGRIALGGTLGGLVGGLVAERLAANLSAQALLPVLAALHLLCGWLLTRVSGRPMTREIPEDSSGGSFGGVAELFRVAYLRNLASLVLTATIAGVCIDYVFKVRATGSTQSAEELLRFFALFYGGVSLLTFLLQAGLADRMLERIGLAGTVATHPAGVAVSSAVALMVPGLASASAARGIESSVRSSLFRTGYEPLFVPLPLLEKRRTKQLIDVGCERVGDMIGGGIIALLLLSDLLVTQAVLLGLAMLLGVLGIGISRRLHSGWVSALEGRLQDRAAELDLDHERDSTKTIVFRTLESLDLGESVPAPSPHSSMEALPTGSETPALLVLSGGDADQIRHLLVRTPRLRAEWIPLVLPLLARDDLSGVVAQSLKAVSDRNAGQYIDRLLDPDQDFAVRRRIPPLLVENPEQRVVDGLLAGLDDRRFEVRYQCGRALLQLRQHHQHLVFDRERVLEVVLKEVGVGRHVWEGHRLLDQVESGPDSPFDEQLLRRRSVLGLEHVFTLLGLVLPPTPLSVAYRGLFTDDRALQGTALEYLESVLPSRVREKLWPYLDADARTAVAPKDAKEALDRLMRSHASIQLDLEAQGQDPA